MTITITNRKGKQSIRATGKDAQALFDAMCRSVDASVAPESPKNGQNPVPNRPKVEIQGIGADQGLSGLQAAGGQAT
jgi:hypothetical protein